MDVRPENSPSTRAAIRLASRRTCRALAWVRRTFAGMKHVFFTAALALAMSAAAAAQTLTTVKVATTPIDVGAEVLYGIDMGFFKQHGLNVDVQFIDNGAAIASAVASGAIQR